MNRVRKSVEWFFIPPSNQIAFWRIVGWWELRRVVFTGIIFSVTCCAVLVYLFALVRNRQYEPDALMMIWPITIFANFAYTTGWMIDGIVTKCAGKRRCRLTTALLIAGLCLWLVPSMFWASLGVYGFM